MQLNEREHKKQVEEWKKKVAEEFESLELTDEIEKYVSSEEFLTFCRKAYAEIKAELGRLVKKETDGELAESISQKVLRTEELFVEEAIFQFKVRMLGILMSLEELLYSKQLTRDVVMLDLQSHRLFFHGNLQELKLKLQDDITAEYQEELASAKNPFRDATILMCDDGPIPEGVLEFLGMLGVERASIAPVEAIFPEFSKKEKK